MWHGYIGNWLLNSLVACKLTTPCQLHVGAQFVDDSWRVQISQEELSEEKVLTRAQKKNARKKQKKKDKKTTEFAFEIEEVTGSLEQMSLSSERQEQEASVKTKETKQPVKEVANSKPMSTAEVKGTGDGEVLKRIRAVRKKLKQIEDLESRIASGDIQKPDQDQLSKIAKKEGFLEELSNLMDEFWLFNLCIQHF